jgi:hypothetical protein
LINAKANGSEKAQETPAEPVFWKKVDELGKDCATCVHEPTSMGWEAFLLKIQINYTRLSAHHIIEQQLIVTVR